ncbi:hypothetical protein MTO96_007480 [Rhipicephalus appendiculatus]
MEAEVRPATPDTRTNNHAGEADLHDVLRWAALHIPEEVARTSLVDVNDAVEEGPKENVGEEATEQSRREESGTATQETVPGVHGAQHKHEPQRQRGGEVEEETPEARQTQDAGSATGQRGQRRPAILEHGTVVPHGSFAVRDRLARFFLLRAHLASVFRHPALRLTVISESPTRTTQLLEELLIFDESSQALVVTGSTVRLEKTGAYN